MAVREGEDSTLHLHQRLPQDTRVVAISAGFPGVSAVLEHGEKLGLWKFIRLEGSRVAIPPAETYLLGAWHPAYGQLLGLGGRIGVLVTSSIGEMDFTPVEWEYLNNILKDPRVDFIWFGQEALARLFPQKGFYAPYPLAPMEPIPVEKQDIITLFCPGGPKKNVANQLAAVALLQRDLGLVLHTNVAQYQPVMDLLGVKYVLHPWLPREEYHRLLASARVNMAVSWCETFSFQVAEAALLGVPSAVSSTIEWMPKRCWVARPNNPFYIATTLRVLAQSNLNIREWALREAEARNGALRQALRQRGLLPE